MNTTIKVAIGLIGFVVGSIIISGSRKPSLDDDPAIKENAAWLKKNPNATTDEIMKHNKEVFKKYERPKDVFDHVNDLATSAFYAITGDLI